VSSREQPHRASDHVPSTSAAEQVESPSAGERGPDYSIVIPVYCNEGSLIPLARALETEVLKVNPEHRGELVFVDDGSSDGSFEELVRIRDESPASVTIIRLTRNFGQYAALIAGYHHARGECVITMSADGQEPPSLINDMLSAHFGEHYEVVIGARTARDESLYRRATSRLYYALLRRLAFPAMPRGGFDAWLLSRRALATFLRNCDVHGSLPGLVLWLGYEAKTVPYRRRARLTGVSRYTFAKKLVSVLDGILAYSFAPVRAMWYSGSALALVGVGLGVLLAVQGLLLGNPVRSWEPVVAVVLFVGGLQMTMLGVLGEYLWRALAQVRDRDLYVIDAIYRSAP
jgi:dolichol-phosphate mannosyltransferase